MYDDVTTPAGPGKIAGRLVRKDADYVLVHVPGHDRLEYPAESPIKTQWKGGPFVLLAFSPEDVQPVAWEDIQRVNSR